jgi:hypothetical protein
MTTTQSTGAKTKGLLVRFTHSEHLHIQSQAKNAELSMSEYVRRSALRRQLPPLIPAINLETYRELGRIGTNVNQMAKAVNTSISEGKRTDLDPLPLQQLAATIQEIRLLLLGINETATDLEDAEDNAA